MADRVDTPGIEADEIYRRLTAATREADRAMEAAGEGGTRHWLTEYFLPALERHGLAVVAGAGGEQ